VLIETRGEGNYIIVAPSGGNVHSTKRPYHLLSGGFDTIPVLSVEERNTLFALARRFDEMPKRELVDRAPTSGHRAGHRPGDAWAKQTSWKEILEPHGWAYIRTDKDITYWRRPGKNRGVSAATGWSEADTLKVYSTSTVFDADTTYTKFAAYCLLEHNSDWGAATKALVERGFGEQSDEGTVIIPPPPGMGTKELQLPNDPLEYPFTDSGNAELFVDAFGEEWCYNYRRKKWMRWHGHWWRPDDTRVVEERALATARLRFHAADRCEDEELAEKARKFARSSENDARIKSMLSRAQSMPAVKDPGLGWDTAPFLLGVENGVVDLLTGELRDGRREDHITQHVPVRYDPAADCPRFQAFIAEIMGHDPALQEFLWLALAYSLTADVREQCLFMCYGRGSNGKTTLLNLMQRLMGEDPASGYARTISARALQQSHGNASASQNDTLSVIVGKRLVTSAELPVRAIDAERLKALAGGDVINTRFLWGEPFDFRPVAKLFLSFNSRPHVGDDSHGFWRKVLLIPFNQCFDPAAEPDLEQKLIAELPGILTWLVSGVAVCHEYGLKTPASVIAATQTYREEIDLLNVFISDCFVSVEGGKIRASECYRV
jgi:putative DNA primase/helicase